LEFLECNSALADYCDVQSSDDVRTLTDSQKDQHARERYHYNLPDNGLTASPAQVRVTYEGQGNNNSGLDLYVYNVAGNYWVVWHVVSSGTTDFVRSMTFDSTTIPSISEHVGGGPDEMIIAGPGKLWSSF
jgi:hypothetical protein